MQSGEKTTPKLNPQLPRARKRTVHMAAEDVKGLRLESTEDDKLDSRTLEVEQPSDVVASRMDLFSVLGEGVFEFENAESSIQFQDDQGAGIDAVESSMSTLQEVSEGGESSCDAGFEHKPASMVMSRQVGEDGEERENFELLGDGGEAGSVNESGQWEASACDSPDSDAIEQNNAAQSVWPTIAEVGGDTSGKNLSEGILVGFLVSFNGDSRGTFFELRSGRVVVTSEPCSNTASIVINHPSVSPMHAVLKIYEGGEITVLDQLSEYGTKIFRGGDAKHEVVSGDRSTLRHGDVVVFGSYALHVCVVLSDINCAEAAE